MKSARNKLDILSAYRELGSYRAAAALCGTTHRTVRRVVEHRGRPAPEPMPRPKNTDPLAALLAERVRATDGRISAKRLLPAARAAGYPGSARNLRRAVAGAKAEWRRDRRVYRPWQPVPGEHLAIDWGTEGGLHVFCAVLVWSRVRFVRFVADETQATTVRLLDLTGRVALVTGASGGAVPASPSDSQRPGPRWSSKPSTRSSVTGHRSRGWPPPPPTTSAGSTSSSTTRAPTAVRALRRMTPMTTPGFAERSRRLPAVRSQARARSPIEHGAGRTLTVAHRYVVAASPADVRSRPASIRSSASRTAPTTSVVDPAGASTLIVAACVSVGL